MLWLFYFFAALTVVPAFFVAFSRNPVNAAMHMIASFVGVAGMLVLLQSYLLAVLQILVYAGAIVVLFLFIIMLIDAEAGPRPGIVTTLASALALLLMVFGLVTLFVTDHGFPWGQAVLEVAPGALAKNYGVELFARFMLPFQLAGLLLLMAMVGVIVISRRQDAGKEVQL